MGSLPLAPPGKNSKTTNTVKLGAATRREKTEGMTLKISQLDQIFFCGRGQNTCKQENKGDGLTRNHNKGGGRGLALQKIALKGKIQLPASSHDGVAHLRPKPIKEQGKYTRKLFRHFTVE